MAKEKETAVEQTAEKEKLDFNPIHVMQRIAELEKELKEAKEDSAKAKEVQEGSMSNGMKQALLERNLQKAMLEAKKDTVKLTLPLLPGRDDEEEAVCGVNGVLWKVRRGEEVEVPRCVAEVFQNADKQKLEAMKRRKGLQKKVEKNK